MLGNSQPNPPPVPPPLQHPSSLSQPPPQSQTTHSKRLIITKMALTNFKSYAGKQEIGPFHKSFTSIVGPNGSGKSNVIDAMLFVFGYRANKMRQGKLSALIHNSEKFQNLEYCTVEVYFNEIIDLPGPDAFQIVPNSTIVVSRTAYRSNASKYQINGRTSSYTEVTDLLRNRGIDLDHKRFLILQGEVESIAQMKPKAQNEHEDGLLEYLEDIIGTSKYKQPLEEASQVVEKLSEEKAEKLNRVRIVESEKKHLEPKKEEAEDFLRSENTLVKKRSILWQYEIADYETRAQAAETEVVDLQGRLKNDQEQHKHLIEDVEKLEGEYSSIAKDYEKIGKETNEVIKELAKFEREDVQLQENKKHLKAKQKKLSKSIEKDQLARSEHETWIRNHDEELKKRMGELEELTKSLSVEEKKLDEIRDGLKGKTEHIQSQIESEQKSLAPWLEKINKTQSEIDVAQSEFDLLEEKSKSGEKAVKEAEQKLEEMLQGIEGKKSAYLKLKHQKKQAAERLESSKVKMKEIETLETDLRNLYTKARQQAEETKIAYQAAQSRGNVLKQLLKERDSGRLKNIHGRLGDLGVIDQKYDIAVSTACPALDHIVVQDVTTAEKCISILREKNLGRSVFICLDKLPQMNLSPIQTPEDVPRLFDLIKPKNPSFAPAFYNSLRDTLVAADLDQANRLAYGSGSSRWRVVTLDGQLIDKSGTMSGGGTKVTKGLMGSNFVDDVNEQEVAKCDHEREKVEKKLKKVEEVKRSVKVELEETEKEIPNVELELSKLEMDIKSLVQEVEETKSLIQKLSAQTQPDQNDLTRMKELSKAIATLTSTLNKLQSSADPIQTAIKELQARILEIGGVKLRSQKAKVDGIIEEMDGVNERITKVQVARGKAEKDLKKAGERLEKGKKELEAVQSELEQVESDIKVKTEAALEVKKKCEEAKMIMADKKEELDSIKAQLDEKSQIVDKIRAVEVEIKARLDELKIAVTEGKKRSGALKAKLKELSLQKIGVDEEEDAETLEELSIDELKKYDKRVLIKQIQDLEAKLSKAKPNLTVLAEYKQRHEEYIERAKELAIVNTQREEAKNLYDDLRKKRLDEFMSGFTAISLKLKEMYQMITLGGNAELELVDSMDPFSEGILFSVMPPKKSWKNISNLSGGEKTLSSLALVFALHHFKPTPLYVMDEIDAALDFRNVSIVANYIKNRTKNAQFVIISLRNNMFELADRLVGIYKTDNCTKSICVNPKMMVVGGAHHVKVEENEKETGGRATEGIVGSS